MVIPVHGLVGKLEQRPVLVAHGSPYLRLLLLLGVFIGVHQPGAVQVSRVPVEHRLSDRLDHAL